MLGPITFQNSKTAHGSGACAARAGNRCSVFMLEWVDADPTTALRAEHIGKWRNSQNGKTETGDVDCPVLTGYDAT